jgi:putative MATE family efflux protein
MSEMKMMFSNAQLKKLIAPLLVEQLLVMLVGMMDTVMVSSVGEAAISGVSIVNEVNFLAITILSALAAGGAVIVSQYFGNRDEKNANLAASQLVMISFLISLLFAVVCLVFCRQILAALYGSVDTDVMKAAVTYFWITSLSFPFLGIYNASSALFRSMNMTKATMWVSILMNSINIIGNYLGVYVFHLGVAGVAWPTLISRMTAAAVLCSFAFTKTNPIHIAWEGILVWKENIVGKILKIAVPNSIENGLFQVGRIVVTAIVATYGTSQTAANGVANSLATLAIIASSAMQLASVTVIGQCVGAQAYDQAKYYFIKLLKIAYVLGFINCAAVLALLPLTISLYTLTPETAQIVTAVGIWNGAVTAILHPVAFVLPNGLRAAGDAKYTMIIGVLSMFLVRIVGAYVLGTVLQLYVLGTYFAMFLDWGVRTIFFVRRYRSDKWMNYRAI